MPHILLFILALIPDASLLGHEEYRVRERAEAAYRNPISASLLREGEGNQEARERVLRCRKSLLTFDPLHVEKRAKVLDYEGWLTAYAIPGKSLLLDDDQLFIELHTNRGAAALFMGLCPGPVVHDPADHVQHFMCFQGVPRFLYGSIQEGERKVFGDHIGYYRNLVNR